MARTLGLGLVNCGGALSASCPGRMSWPVSSEHASEPAILDTVFELPQSR
jgi:hypothetical protein